MKVFLATKKSKNMQTRIISVILFNQNICKTDTELDSLKKNALNTAESFFDGGLYLDVLNKVVNESK